MYQKRWFPIGNRIHCLIEFIRNDQIFNFRSIRPNGTYIIKKYMGHNHYHDIYLLFICLETENIISFLITNKKHDLTSKFKEDHFFRNIIFST